jgi:hypothetical protein
MTDLILSPEGILRRQVAAKAAEIVNLRRDIYERDRTIARHEGTIQAFMEMAEERVAGHAETCKMHERLSFVCDCGAPRLLQ